MEIKNVLISDQLDKRAVELLNKANMNVQVNTSLNSQKLISEIKVSEILSTGCPLDRFKSMANHLFYKSHQNYDALLVRSTTQVTADVINAAPNLKFIGRAGVSIDNIDVNAATNRGITVAK